MGKRIGMAAIAVLLLVAGGRLAVWFLFERSPEISPPPAVVDVPVTPEPVPEPVVEREATVTAVDGRVERRSGQADWAPLALGDSLAREDEVRTSAGGSATLDITDLATVRVDPDSRLSLQELTTTIARLRLDEGRVGAKARGEQGAKLRLETAGSDAAAEAESGEFSMLASGDGDIVVATNNGRVVVSAKGEQVEVLPGKQTFVRRGTEPSAPAPVPKSLLLKVKGPSQAIQRARSITVTGRSSPGAIVSVNDVSAVAGEDGRFSATVPLRDGDNRITASARDTQGQRRESLVGQVTVKSKLGAAESVIEWGSP